ncbi:MAG: glycoside hydrolase family 97 N-terminal domain-containing protein, partial [Acidobacteriota bacterium]|nr:glycoside hydrolase family 97 N-terminal domain-containing protein [Acidobacteriota bacterium]
PNGRFEFRIFSGQPQGALWPRIGYQIYMGGKPMIGTSWMGLDILNQEPYLAENPGFMSADRSSNSKDGYNALVAHYMQNGSLGRRLDVEIRAYNDGVAFRYIVPKSTALEDFLLRDEETEFNFAEPSALARLPAKPDYDLPFAVEEPGIGWVVIAQQPPPSGSVSYPRMYLDRTAAGMITNLARSIAEPNLAYDARTPVVWLWRVVLGGPERSQLLASETLRSLGQ